MHKSSKHKRKPDEYIVIRQNGGYRVRTKSKKPSITYKYRWFGKPMSQDAANKYKDILVGFANDRFYDKLKHDAKYKYKLQK